MVRRRGFDECGNWRRSDDRFRIASCACWRGSSIGSRGRRRARSGVSAAVRRLRSNGSPAAESDGDRIYDARYDDAPSAWITTTFIDGELAGTVKVNIGIGRKCDPSRTAGLRRRSRPQTVGGEVVAEFTRLAARLSFRGSYPELAYIVMRPAFMAAEYFDADLAVATPRAEHIAFYRRAFGAVVWRPPRRLSGTDRQILHAWGLTIDLRDNSSSRAIPFSSPIRLKERALFGPGEKPVPHALWKRRPRSLAGLGSG